MTRFCKLIPCALGFWAFAFGGNIFDHCLPASQCFAQEKEQGSEQKTEEETPPEDQSTGENTTTSDAQEKLSALVQQMVQDGDIRDARELVNKFIAENDLEEIETVGMQQNFALLLAGFSRAQNNREIFKTLNQLFEFQMQKLESGDMEVQISGSLQPMAAVAQSINKLDEFKERLQQAVAAYEPLTKDSPENQVVMQFAFLRSMEAQIKMRDGDREGAIAMLQEQHESLKALFAKSEEDELVLAVYGRSLINLMRASDDNAEIEPLYAEHQKIYRKRIEEKPDNISHNTQYLSALMFWGSRISQDDPETAIEMVTEGEGLIAKLEEANADAARAVPALKQGLARLKRRCEGQLVVNGLIDKPAPEFDAETWQNGDELTADNLKGKVVMLDFWAVWCGPCIRTFPKLKQLHADYHDQGLEIVGVTRHYGFGWDEERKAPRREQGIDGDAENDSIVAFMKNYELPYPTMVTPAESTMNTEFGVTGIPHVVLIGRKGNIRLIKVGAGEETSKEIEAKIKELLAE